MTATPNLCTISGNNYIGGAVVPSTPYSFGVRCDTGSCATIERNHVDGRSGQTGIGLTLLQTGTLVSRNDINPGCSPAGVGVGSFDSFARVENNHVLSGSCSGLPSGAYAIGVWVVLAPGDRELDLNSNTITSLGASGNCSAAAIDFSSSDAGVPRGPRGVVRNNIFDPGPCLFAVAAIENTPDVDPFLFENNDLIATDAGVYIDEGATLFSSVAAVNVLTGAAANISADPQFDGGLHLGAGSPCRNRGTPAGAPSEDYDGDPRPQEGVPDIGADEYRP
jgi:hypothetical protein